MRSSRQDQWDMAQRCLVTLMLTWSSTLMVTSCHTVPQWVENYSCVCIPVGVKSERIKESGFIYYLRQLDTFLRDSLGGHYVQTLKDKESLTRGRSVQFNYKGKVDVDLLVSPNWKDQFQFYSFLRPLTPGERQKWVNLFWKYTVAYSMTKFPGCSYTVFAAKWQVQFFKHRPPEVVACKLEIHTVVHDRTQSPP